MHPVILKTLGGLSKQYYFRQMFFSILIGAMAFTLFNSSTHPMQSGLWVVAFINLLLYPYSRFVYESVVGFLVGENVFFVNALFMLISKMITMLMCWWFAIFIAPVGLLYLYVYHSRKQAE